MTERLAWLKRTHLYSQLTLSDATEDLLLFSVAFPPTSLHLLVHRLFIKAGLETLTSGVGGCQLDPSVMVVMMRLGQG